MDLVMVRCAICSRNRFGLSTPSRKQASFALHPLWSGITIKPVFKIFHAVVLA
jgi:hypothetical protein